jgi:hypothetical protein
VKSAAAAILWESWMMTRWGYLSRLVVALAFLLLISTIYETREAVDEEDLLGVRVFSGIVGLLCGLSALGVGRFSDGRKGFPFYLGFSRPVPTWIQVMIPMTYRAIFCTALYLIPVLIAHYAYEMTNLSIASSLLVIPFTFLILANSWWTDKQGMVPLVVGVTIYFGAGALGYYTLHLNDLAPGEDPIPMWWAFSFTWQDYLTILLASIAAIALTLAGVENQRHGGGGLGAWFSEKFGSRQADADWLTELYQTECPITNAKHAELWSEINGRGLPVFVWSLMAALCIPMIWFLSNLFDSRALHGIGTGFTVFIPLLAAPTFGIVTKQGSSYLSTFDATRPLNTLWLVGMKMTVAVVSMIAGILVIAVSMWFSTPLVEGFIGGVEVGKENILSYFESLPTIELVLLILVRLVQFSTMVAFLATLSTTYVLYTNRMTYAVLGLLLYACTLPILLATKIVPVSFALAQVWPLLGLMIAVAAYFFFWMAKNAVIKPVQIAALVIVWILYTLAYFYLLREDEIFAPETPVEFVAIRVFLCLLSLVVVAMAPWSLAMIRHR